jgi:hypothetical protein
VVVCVRRNQENFCSLCILFPPLSEVDFENGKENVFSSVFGVAFGWCLPLFPQWKLEGYKWKQKIRARFFFLLDDEEEETPKKTIFSY